MSGGAPVTRLRSGGYRSRRERRPTPPTPPLPSDIEDETVDEEYEEKQQHDIMPPAAWWGVREMMEQTNSVRPIAADAAVEARPPPWEEIPQTQLHNRVVYDFSNMRTSWVYCPERNGFLVAARLPRAPASFVFFLPAPCPR